MNNKAPIMVKPAVLPNQTAGGLYSATPPTRYAPNPNSGQGLRQMDNSFQSGGGGYSGGYTPTNSGTTGNMNGFKQFEDAAFNQGMRRIDPQIAAQNRAFEQAMIAKGIDPGTQAYDNAFANQNRGHNDLRSQVAFGAQQAGLAAQNQFAQQDLTREGFANQTGIANINAAANRYGADSRAEIAMQQLNEQNRQFDLTDLFRTNQLNEGARQFDSSDVFRNQQLDQQGLFGMGNLFLGMGNQDLQRQGMQNGFNNNWFNQNSSVLGQAPGNSFTPTGGLVENTVGASQNIANANAQRAGGFGNLLGAGLGAAATAGGFGALFSDKRLKKNIKFIKRENGINIYEYEYKNKELGIGKQIGVMAQEIMHSFPEAVKKVKGMFAVDYSKLPMVTI